MEAMEVVLPELPPFADLFKVKLEPNNRESQENICENSPRGSGGVETIEICLSGEFSLPRNAVKQKLLRAGVRVIDFFKQKTVALCLGEGWRHNKREEAMLMGVPIVDGRYVETILAGNPRPADVGPYKILELTNGEPDSSGDRVRKAPQTWSPPVERRRPTKVRRISCPPTTMDSSPTSEPKKKKKKKATSDDTTATTQTNKPIPSIVDHVKVESLETLPPQSESHHTDTPQTHISITPTPTPTNEETIVRSEPNHQSSSKLPASTSDTAVSRSVESSPRQHTLKAPAVSPKAAKATSSTTAPRPSQSSSSPKPPPPSTAAMKVLPAPPPSPPTKAPASLLLAQFKEKVQELEMVKQQQRELTAKFEAQQATIQAMQVTMQATIQATIQVAFEKQQQENNEVKSLLSEVLEQLKGPQAQFKRYL